MSIESWIEEIKSAKKRDKDFRKDGEEILEIYSGEKETPFNILYSNTETLLPAVFSQVPRPVVQRRFKDEDPLGRYVSEASQRMLEYLVDTDVDGYDKFEDSVSAAVLDGLLPGRGVTSIKYDSDDDVSWETVCTDSRQWNRVYFGYAKKWINVPWIAYEEYLDKEEAKRLFGNKVNKLTFTEGEEKEDHEEEETEDQGKRKTTLIYQIWDKEDKKIKYLSPNYKDGFLREDDDPLGLTGFFNCPEPITFLQKNDLVPKAIYKLYEQQAKELNKIQMRLNRVIDAIKVRGVYDGNLGEEIENLLKESDNALVPTDKTSALLDGGLDAAIWFLPLNELMQVAQALLQAREATKRVIYEITGISDIVRGQSMASETLGAQKIKEAWGTMRLKRLQKEVQRYALDTMRLMLDIAVKKFSAESWAKMTGLPYPTAEQKQQAQQMLQRMQEQAQMQAQTQPQTQPPAPPPQPDPKLLQAAQLPSWEEILKVLKDNYSRSYRVDIETNSTLDVEATEDKQLVGDFMNAMAQFLNGMGPLIEKQIMPFGAAKSMMLSIVKRYRFGREVEDELKAMKEPTPQQSPEMQQAQKKLQQDQQKFQDEQKRVGEELDQRANNLAQEEMQFKYDKQLAKMQLDFEAKIKDAQQNMNEVEAKSDLKEMIIKHKSDVQSMLDKQVSRVESCMSKPEKPKETKAPEINIVNQMPDGNKSIKIERENGMISGATVGD